MTPPNVVTKIQRYNAENAENDTMEVDAEVRVRSTLTTTSRAPLCTAYVLIYLCTYFSIQWRELKERTFAYPDYIGDYCGRYYCWIK